MSTSEIARPKSRIDCEVQAMPLALHGYAECARHEIVNRRFACLQEVMGELSVHIGSGAAIALIGEVLEETL
ncbi:MAG: hypothetical protein ACRDHW_09465 [Ktedonobacteraceae bacterium]